MHSHFISRQPIIDHDGNIIAYDIHYNHLGTSPITQHELISSFLLTLLNTYGINNILGGKRGFLQVDHTVLLSEEINMIPKEHFVLALLSSTIIDSRVYNKIIELTKHGYSFAIHDIDLQSAPKLQSLKRIFPLIDYLKINAKDFSEPYLVKLSKIMKIYAVELIATRVEDHTLYGICSSANIPYVQGDYFSEPLIMKHQVEDPKTFAVIQIYNKLMSDADIEELVEIFECNNDLTLQLLSYINSLSFNLSQKVSSIQQVLTLLGRRALGQWLMLLIYGKSFNTSKYQSPLLLMVQNRSIMMAEIYKLMYPNSTHEEVSKARFVAIMSLSSAVMSVPLTLILKEMNLSDEIKKALLEKEGVLGELLLFVKAIEKYNLQNMNFYFKKFNLTVSRVFGIMAKTIVQVNHFNSL